ncbi:FtsW/RodA/SpoVE family cell cycle protein [Halobacillus sp. A5]|uniref:FtsW/RodA/SpoVE family cell cycle protein n=1 Tax=Halobacillus sp. A5 TaxID=2880263 RepID=UPI0020A63309|nr:FtsW/RodA/SpoVE family cell cycle protein [Halobacillus sp. A5]MCP3027322.1 rod shape-determining protein RodA [Halobacillus sp. A5]
MNFEERFDWKLFFIICMFITISCVALYSAQQSPQYNENFMLKQLVWFGAGGIIIGIMLYFEPDFYKKISWPLYIAGILVLLALVIAPPSIAPVVKGQKSWFILPGMGSIQPSEFMKVFTILILSNAISNHHEKVKFVTIKSDFLLLGKITGLTFIPLALIMQQPDLGTSLVFLAIMAGMILISGISWKIITPIFGSLAATGLSLIWLALKFPQILDQYFGVKEYQLGRIYAWLNPQQYGSSEGFQLIRAMRSIGSGQMFGKGLGERELYLPEAHTDFIFSIIGEEYGFLGSCVVLLTFFLFIYRLTTIATRANHRFSTYVMVGLICMVSFHVFQNIGMSIQLLPITGIPLPYISYGGSSLLAFLIAAGLAFSVSYHHRTYMFGED